MYKQLAAFSSRPAPFSRYTASTLWTDPHIARQMLAYHLNPTHDIASRNPGDIRQIADWLANCVGLAGRRVCDLGCGPGLYAAEFARRGAQVVGCDFSKTSLSHAVSAARESGLSITYRQMDYLIEHLPDDQELIVLVYGDICALSPDQRRLLFSKVYRALKPGGAFVIDAFPAAQFAGRQETETFGRCLMDGFWAEGDYFAFLHTFRYPDRTLILDRYLILTEQRSFEVFNWLQYFQPGQLAHELVDAGFSVESILDAVTGADWTDTERMFALVTVR